VRRTGSFVARALCDDQNQSARVVADEFILQTPIALNRSI
jgi:hypothetical protein